MKILLDTCEFLRLVTGDAKLSGGKDLALELKAKGYDWILKG